LIALRLFAYASSVAWLRTRRSVALLLASVVMYPGITSATGDEQRGRMLYENHCMACHDSVIHVRERHKVDSLEGIRRQVVIWSREIRLDWTEEEYSAVTSFLNAKFYGFAAPDNGQPSVE
jgi:cytochrome c1